MMTEPEKVICVGAGLSQMPYIKEIRNRGYHPFCVDQNPDSPGFRLSDDYVVSSTFDYKNTPRLIFKKLGNADIKSVIAPCTGPPMHTAQKVRRLFGLSSYTEEITSILMDKLHLREKCNSISCSNIRILNNRETLNHDCFPLIRKPRFGGMGGQEVEAFFSLDEYQRVHESLDIDQQYTYESLILGREIAVDAIWDGNSIVFLSIGWTLFDTSLDIIIGSTSQEDCCLNTPNVRRLLHKFCSSIQLGPEVINADIILDHEGTLHLIEVEFAPADGIVLCREAFGYHLIRNYVSTYLGDMIQALPKRKKNAAMIFNTHTESSAQPKKRFRGDFYPIQPYQIHTRKGPAIIDSYYLISNDSSEQLMHSIQNISPKISVERYTHA